MTEDRQEQETEESGGIMNMSRSTEIGIASLFVGAPFLAMAAEFIHLSFAGFAVGTVSAGAIALVGKHVADRQRKNGHLPQMPFMQRLRTANWSALLDTYEPEPTVVVETTLESGSPEEIAPEQTPAAANVPVSVTRKNNMSLALAPNFAPDIDAIIGEGIVVFGSKGSGKTNVGALLAEQFGRYHVPMVIFDLEGDYASLVTVVPHGKRANASTVSSEEGAYKVGWYIMEYGYQVVFDLASYSDEDAALIMQGVIKGLTAWANAQPPESRVPCLVFLDEAAYWLPQSRVSYLSGDTLKALRDTFHVLATKGRKRGLTPILLTQRISELEKSVMAQANIYMLMKQSLDNDLDRYMDYVNRSVATREQIAAFGPGQAIVKMPDGTQFTTTFHQRVSAHISHTPRAAAAVARYQSRPQNTTPPGVVTAPLSVPTVQMRDDGEPYTQTMPTASLKAPVASDIERALVAWNAGHSSVTKLQYELGVTHNKAYKLYQQLKERRLI